MQKNAQLAQSMTEPSNERTDLSSTLNIVSQARPMLGSTEADRLVVHLARTFLDSFYPKPQAEPSNVNLQSLNIDF